MANKKIKWLGNILALALIFTTFVLSILYFQGKFDSEKKETQSETETKKSSSLPSDISLSLPSPFSFAEVAKLSKELEKLKAEYAEKLKSVEAEKEQLRRFREDIEERRIEVLKLMEKVNVLYAQTQENKKTTRKSKKIAMTKEQRENLKKLTKIFESMPTEQAAERLGNIDIANAAQILLSMNSRNASKILSSLEPDKVKEITDLMQNKNIQNP